MNERVTERAARIDDIGTALLRARTCHGAADPNQDLFDQIGRLVTALIEDATLRVAKAS